MGLSLTKVGYAMALAASLSACSLTGGDLVRSGEATGIIQIENLSGTDLTAVLISDCDNFTYGLNRLGDGETIPHGGARSFTVSAGCWDVSVGYGWSTGYAEARHRFTIPAGGVQVYQITG